MELKVKFKCKTCQKEFEDFTSNERSGFCSLLCYWQARKNSQTYKGYWTGKKRSLEDRKKMSVNRKGLTAKEKHPKWKGGISILNHQNRQSFEYKEWRKAVLRRDKWSCVLCGYRSKGKVNGRSDIEADHVKRFSEYPGLRYEVSNGRTLCKSCHLKITFSK